MNIRQQGPSFTNKFSFFPVVLDQGGVDDVAPEVGEHEGAGHQQVENGDLHLANCEGEAEDV